MEAHRQFSIKALVLGFLTDVGGSLLFGIVFAILLGIYFGIQGLPESEIVTRLQGQGLLILLPSMVVGFGFTVLGGYVAGRISKMREVFHGGLVGGLGLLFGLFFWASLPLWYNIVALLGVIPCGMLGGRIAKPTHLIDADTRA